MSTSTQVQHGMSPQVKRGVLRWAVRETLGVVMLAVLLFLTAGTLMIARTSLEDKTWQAELPGYVEYTQRTRDRLLPGVW